MFYNVFDLQNNVVVVRLNIIVSSPDLTREQALSVKDPPQED